MNCRESITLPHNVRFTDRALTRRLRRRAIAAYRECARAGVQFLCPWRVVQ
jgi:hypothetical protein